MGMEKYETYVRRAMNTLTYGPGWSLDNRTGSWRTERPLLDSDKCNSCKLCWLYCPEGCIEAGTFAIDMAYCKGCGICATECPIDAIEMKPEASEAEAT
jgi:2-oxoacid:acceptor oxidoreductase delta subunit (pyruvate/2-ketoisovalerate family)